MPIADCFAATRMRFDDISNGVALGAGLNVLTSGPGRHTLMPWTTEDGSPWRRESEVESLASVACASPFMKCLSIWLRHVPGRNSKGFSGPRSRGH